MHRHTEADRLDPTFENARYCLGTVVHHVHRYRQIRLGQGLQVQPALDEGILDRHTTTWAQHHRSEQSHIAIGRRRIPVDKTSGEVPWFRRHDLNRHDVFANGGDPREIELKPSIRALGIVGRGDGPPIDPDIGRMVDPVELKQDRLGRFVFGQGKLRPIPPRLLERLCWHFIEIRSDIQILVPAIGDQSRQDGRRHSRGQPASRVETQGGNSIRWRRHIGRRLDQPALAQGSSKIAVACQKSLLATFAGGCQSTALLVEADTIEFQRGIQCPATFIKRTR